MSHPHPELSAPPPLPNGGLRVIALGGLGEVGRNMTVFEYDGRLLDRRLRGAVPGGEPPRRRPDPARLRRHPGPARRHRRAGADPRSRGPHRRGSLPAARAIRHPAGRLPAHPGPARLQAPRAPAAGHRRSRSSRRATGSASARSTSSSWRSTTRSPTPSRSPSARPAGMVLHTGDFKMDQLPLDGRITDLRCVRPAGGGGRRPVPDRLDQRRGPRLHHLRAQHRAGAGARLPHQQEADHRGLLRLPRAPRPADDGRRRRARPQGRLRRPVDGAQHGHRPRPRLPRRTPRPAGRPQGDRGHAARAGRADLHRLPGRAAVGAEPDRPAQPPLRAHRGGRHRRPRLLADPRQRERRLPGDQRPGALRRPRRAQGQRTGPRERPRQRGRAALLLQHRPAAQRDAGARRDPAHARQRRAGPGHRRSPRSES